MKEESVAKEANSEEVFLLDQQVSYMVESAEGASEESEVELNQHVDHEAFDEALETLISETG